MKNNRGIILSTYIYILLVFFIVLLTTMLMVLNNTKLLATKIKENASNQTKSGYNDFNIILLGDKTVSIVKGTAYIDNGYIAQFNSGISISAIAESTVNINTAGTYTYKYTIKVAGITKSVTRTVNVFETENTYSYTGSAQTFTSRISGYYQVELWGAGGNTWNGLSNPGLGGYTSGIIYLNKDEILYVYVGSNATSFNGGSVGGKLDATEIGGGSTDVRLVGGAWNDTTSLYSRIMVAGAGGGTGEASGKGGNGGGLIASNGATTGSGTGGSQTAGGAGGTTATVGSPGGFGYGGAGGLEATYGRGGSGGSGYYGGGGGSGISGTDGAGAGGSSFISGFAGVNATTGSTKHRSDKYFIGGIMTPGIKTGVGSAKITYLGTSSPTRVNTTLNNVRYIKDCATGNSVNTYKNWVELQAIYNGENVAKGKSASLISGATLNSAAFATDGLIDYANNAYINDATGQQCLFIDLGKIYNLDEIAVWHYWGDDRTFYNNVTYASSDNTNWTTVISASEAETSQGKRISAWGYRMQNIVANGSFTSATVTGWSTAASSVTNTVSGTLTAGGLYMDDTSETTGFWSYYPFTIVAGHIYYNSMDAKINTVGALYVTLAIRDTSGVMDPRLNVSSANTEYTRYSSIFTALATHSQIQLGIGTTSMANAYVKNIMLIDLTAAFGAGKEPTKEWCDANLNYFAGIQNLNLSP